jgi:hypothetical protein
VISWNTTRSRRALVRRLVETAEGEAASYGTDAREVIRCLAAAVEADNRRALEDMTTNVLLVAAAHGLAPGLEGSPRDPPTTRAPAKLLVARLRNPWLLMGASVVLVVVASMSRQCHPESRLLEAPIALPVEGRS